MSFPFVHLHVHTEYSLIDSIIRIGDLVDKASELNMPAVALTDQNNLFALVKFYRAALAAGIKPIIGADMYIKGRDQEAPSKLVLLCQNQNGYRNLVQLISRSYREGQYSGLPLVDRSWLAELSGNLIALSSACEGDIGRALLGNKLSEAQECLSFWVELFSDRFYLELQRAGRENEEEYIALALQLADQNKVPVVASNDVRFLEKKDFEVHETRVCIHDGRTLDDPRRPRIYSDGQYFTTTEEMQELFSDIPEALENAYEIAKRCNFVLKLGESYLPQFPVPKGETIESYFISQSKQGLEQRLLELCEQNPGWTEEQTKQYYQRLDMEIKVIGQMGFPGYFLIVADFIRWAKANDIPVGPGRGSGAGSLVAYALCITDLDPIEYDLLFERFLNPERVSLPDFDIDFCMESRDRVIDYVADTYGRDKVSQIITHGTMAAKAVVRDVGRVLGHPYNFVDRIAKLVPFEIGMTLDKALEHSEELSKVYQEEEEVTTLIDLARSLEGLTRNAGKHAGGVVIAPSELTDYTPLYCEQDGQGLVTQLDKDDVESIGLVKFDFLGLRTLTIIDWTAKSINKQRMLLGEDLIDINKIALNDAKVFDLLKRHATTAVFQLESRGMKDLIKRLQPDSFDDIIALVALFRPGPLQSGMVDDFIARKHGKAVINYPHPALVPILKPTYGVILYQEQVMQIAQILAGYTLGEADLLRRAMGKKKPEEMAKQREIFTNGAVKNDVKLNVATNIFDLMEKFAGYGFNKSHSAAYALLSYQTAWLKAHFPAEFMAAVLSSDMDNTDKVDVLVSECRTMNLQIIPPDINHSQYKFTAGKDGIIFGLGAIKGLGSSAIESILKERSTHTQFIGLHDFCRRVDPQKINKRTQEALIRSGALDSLGANRATLMKNLASAVKAAEQLQRDSLSGQASIFGEVENNGEQESEITTVPEWDEEYRLNGEKETIGFYLTGHPITRYQDELRSITGKSLAEQIENYEVKAPPSNENRYAAKEIEAIVAGLIMSVRIQKSKNGKRAILVLDDDTARVDVMLWSDDFAKYQHYIVRDKVLVVDGNFAYDDFSGGYRVRAKQVFDLDAAREHYAKFLELGISATMAANGLMSSLSETLKPFNGGACPVWVYYENEQARVPIKLGDDWRVSPKQQLIESLEGLIGDTNVRLVY